MPAHKIGIIGYGGFGQFLHNSWRSNKRVEVVAVADPLVQAPVENNLMFFQDWHQLLTVPEIEIVSIVTPPSTHVELAILALEHNKHVILEKPLAIDMPSAKRLKAIIDKSKRTVVIDFMLRFHPFIQTLKKWVGDGTLGNLRRVLVENYAQDECLPPDHWFWDKRKSGGILVEHGVHFIDLVNYIVDSHSVEVNGMAIKRNSWQEDQVLTSVRYDNGVIATHYHDFSRPGFFESTKLRFIFELAEIEITGWIPLSGKIKALVNKNIRRQLGVLPHFQPENEQPIGTIKDDSRPEGWGISDRFGSTGIIFSGGNEYRVTHQLEGHFRLQQSKSEIYSQLVNSVLNNLLDKIEQPDTKLFVTTQQAITGLEIALQACPG